ncbi:unnamed protein product, partial [Closterium sp. NIES-53]
MDVWGPARVRGQGHECHFLLVVDDYSRYTIVFPLRSKGEATEVLIDRIRVARLRLRERFGSDFPDLRLHSDRGGEFSSDLLRAFCRAEGIRQTFTLPASPQQNGIAERRISMYAAHHINLQPRVSLPETSPTLRWTEKLSSRAVPCVFLGFPPDAPGWQFYHPTSRCVLSSQDVTFDDSVPYYRLFPYRTAPLPPPPLFLAPDAVEPDEVDAYSGASGGAEPKRAESGGAGSWGAKPERAEPWGAASGGAEPGVAGSGGVEPAGAGPGGPSGAFCAARAGGATGAGGSDGAGGTGAGGAARAGAGATAGAGGAAGVGDTGGTGAEAAVSAGGPAGAGAAAGPGAGGAAGVGAEAGGAGIVPAGSGGATRPRPYFVLLLVQVLGLPPSSSPAPSLKCPPPVQSESHLQLASPLPAPSPYAGPTRGLVERREPESRPALPVRTARTSRRVPRPRPPAVAGTHQMALRPSNAPQRVPLPSPPESSLPALADSASDSLRAASPTVTRFLASVVTDPSFESTAASASARCRLDYAASLVA